MSKLDDLVKRWEASKDEYYDCAQDLKEVLVELRASPRIEELLGVVQRACEDGGMSLRGAAETVDELRGMIIAKN